MTKNISNKPASNKKCSYLNNVFKATKLNPDLNFQIILFFIIIGIALFLRFYKISFSYPWGGEQGTNYLELKNYYENGEVPLKGPLTGRSWLQLQPLYYWIIMPIFVIFKWNPIVPAYFFAIVSMLMAYVNYKFVKKWFNNFVAKISTIFILISPFWLRFTKDSRFYFLSTFISYFYFYFLIKGIKEKRENYIYFSIFILFTMLHFHYVALAFIPSLLIILFLKKSEINISYRKSFIYALIPSIPFFIVNIYENFVPFYKTTIWIPYRIAGFLGIIEKNKFTKGVFISNIKSLIFIHSRQLFWEDNLLIFVIATCIVIFSLYIFVKNIQERKISPIYILLMTFWTLYAVLFIHGDPPYHYYINVLFIPSIIVGLVLGKLKDKLKIFNEDNLLILITVFLIFLNYRFYFLESWFGKKYKFENNKISYGLQLKISGSIITDASGQPFYLKRVGAFDYYDEHFAQNYQYLLWWMGNEPNKNSNILYTIYEDKCRYEQKENTEIIFNEYNILVTKVNI